MSSLVANLVLRFCINVHGNHTQLPTVERRSTWMTIAYSDLHRTNAIHRSTDPHRMSVLKVMIENVFLRVPL